MAERIVTGFHAIEERIRSDSRGSGRMRILWSKAGPRAKKIIALAKQEGIPCEQADDAVLDSLAARLSETARDHRGIVLCISGESEDVHNIVDFDEWLASLPSDYDASPDQSGVLQDDVRQNTYSTVLILDSVTDPHNVGAIIRSCDQFGTSLVILPQARSANDIAHNEVIARSSAGAAAWVPVSVVPNAVRAVQRLKEAGFWVYGADAGGEALGSVDFARRTVIVMGSEGKGISPLLAKNCDAVVSIPTCGKIDSLNVSVAAGILLYERYRRFTR
ncbi:23S rRNA (guanosine(2251)-2'-O)-methyltransferase RlmB [Treponema sp. Marseille-Q4132]|uniref:23S rRNA (guanosine(2251)-2'-O)-methyltransferase RlmB n=1 Tax=Treponema sp. Marseille-Q4132 TaxID=2766701 RepID=UPI001652F53B|nr:23S rRNA (guanosine(2251)-2'-O)-methyltransferase RlmB [Treponema sp. Marseille-Q4132]QNL98307.1 23S rRNA (guanosine(2251)-2'-O)-methyltransferase RlmB [Treponema sp. Marseille-Q4132]